MGAGADDTAGVTSGLAENRVGLEGEVEGATGSTWPTPGIPSSAPPSIYIQCGLRHEL